MAKIQPFCFKHPIRAFVMQLGDLLEYANSREDGMWAAQSTDPDRQGVYGHVYNAIKAIIHEEMGVEVAETAMERINFGGCVSFGDDIENAVQEALGILASTCDEGN